MESGGSGAGSRSIGDGDARSKKNVVLRIGRAGQVAGVGGATATTGRWPGGAAAAALRKGGSGGEKATVPVITIKHCLGNEVRTTCNPTMSYPPPMLPTSTIPTSTAGPEAMGDALPSRPPITSCLPGQRPRTEYHEESSGDLGLHQGDAQELEHGGSIDDLVSSLDGDAFLRLRQGFENFRLVETQHLKMDLSYAFWTSNQYRGLVERATAGDCPSYADLSHAVHEVFGNAMPSIQQKSFRRFQNFVKEAAVKVSELFGP